MSVMDHLVQARLSVTAHFARARESLRAMTIPQILMAVLVVLLVLVGGVGQLLALNFWVQAFPPEANGLFTILTLSSLNNAIVFSAILGVWALIKKPQLEFMKERFGILVVSGAGVTVGLNGVLIVAGTFWAPEVFQALLLSTMLPWTFLFVKVLFAEKRSYLSPLVILSFVMSFAGIVLGAAQGFASSTFNLTTWMWTLIFAVGVIPGAMNSVLSAKYMRRFTDTTAEEEAHRRKHSVVGFSETTALTVNPDAASRPFGHPVTDGTTAKLAMLALSGVAQVFAMLVLVPTSAIPWFGATPLSPAAANVGVAYKSIGVGLQCAFGSGHEICTSNFHYMLAFNICFLVGGAAQAFLNFYSPALTSIVTQMQSPLSALVLIIIPAMLPPGQSVPNVGYTVGAVLFLIVGAIVYTTWEESTRQQKHDELGSPILEENIGGVIISGRDQ